MNIKAVLSAAACLATIALSGPAVAQVTAPPMPGMMMHGQHASNHNIRNEHHRLLKIIEALQRDDRDYGGHRVRAINYLRQARMELEQALQYERAH
jgi:hypothetical protein